MKPPESDLHIQNSRFRLPQSELTGKSISQQGHIKIEEPGANLVSQSDSNEHLATNEDEKNFATDVTPQGINELPVTS